LWLQPVGGRDDSRESIVRETHPRCEVGGGRQVSLICDFCQQQTVATGWLHNKWVALQSTPLRRPRIPHSHQARQITCILQNFVIPLCLGGWHCYHRVPVPRYQYSRVAAEPFSVIVSRRRR